MMKRTRWFPAYTADKSGELRPTLSDRWDVRRAGVYFIREAATTLLTYVGESGSQLKKTIYRHFQSWNDKSQYRVWYEKTGYEVRFIVCTPSQATRLERYFIRKLKPRDNVVQNRTFWDKITDPKEEKIKDLGKEAQMCAFLKKDEYFQDDWDDTTPPITNKTKRDEPAPF